MQNTSVHSIVTRAKPALAALVSLAMGFSLSPALAADAPSPDDEPADKTPVELEPVVATANDVDAYTVEDSSAATKLPMALRQTPQSVTVITRARMDDQDLTSLRAVLDNTTGVYSDAYDTERVLFYSRGFVIDNLMYDGVPALSSFNTGSIDETIDTALYDRIEVVRGATGLMTGAGSPGASINLVRKHADSTTPRFAFDVTVGSWNDTRGEADISIPLNADSSIRGRTVAVYEDSDSYQDLYHKKKKVLYGIVDADLSPSTLLSIGFDYQNNQPRGNTWGSFPLFLADGTLADWPRSVTTATDWSFWDRRTETVFGELRQSFDNDWSLRTALNWRRYNEDAALFYMYGFPDPVTGEGLEPYAYRNKGEIIERALDVYASGPVTLFGRQHEIVFGYNGSRSSNTGTEYEPGELADPGNFFEWDGSYPMPSFAYPGIPLADIDTEQNGLYAAARFSLADPLKLIAGARYATWKVDSFYIYDTPTLSKYDYRETIPYAGFVYDFAQHYSLFASYTGIFKPQNSRDITGHYLDPVDGQSFEAGVKGEHFDGRLNTSLTVFETRQNNVAGPVFDPETGEPVLLPDGTQVSRAIDGTRTRGFEVEAAGRLGDDWQVSIGGSRYVMHDGDGQPVRTYIPGTLIRAFATWTPSQWLPGLALGGGVNWQSRSSTFVGTPDGGTILAQTAVTQLSVMARYQFTPQLSLQLNGNNLLDRKYYVLDEYDNTYYGAPANYSLSLRYTF
jgi:outer-membrane receptor for ferric coprogen and ferric-rhodotorulic acid